MKKTENETPYGRELIIDQLAGRGLTSVTRRHHGICLLRDGRNPDGSLSYLREVGHLRSMRLIGWKFDDTDAINSLSELHRLEYDCTGSNWKPDYSKLPKLEWLKAYWPTIRKSALPQNLKRLELTKYDKEDLSCMPLEQVVYLAVWRSSITSLKGLSGARNLRFLSLYDNRKLEDFGELASCSKLQELEVESCKHFNELPVLPALRVLTLNKCGTVRSLSSVLSARDIRNIYIWNDTKIEDGRLSILRTLPNLKGVNAQQFRHYDVDTGVLRDELQSKEFTLPGERWDRLFPFEVNGDADVWRSKAEPRGRLGLRIMGRRLASKLSPRHGC